MDTTKQQYILLPKRGIRATEAEARTVLTSLPHARSTQSPSNGYLEPAGAEITVVDSINEDGPKLVELSHDDAAQTNGQQSPLRAVPLSYYDHPNRMDVSRSAALPGAVITTVTIECLDATTSAPIAGASVYAFDNYARRTGDSGVTDAVGQVQLHLASATIQRLFIPGTVGYWGGYRTNVTVSGTLTVPIAPVDLTFVDAVRHYYPATRFNLSSGVRVGVIDTGCGPHIDLNIFSGHNTVSGEPGQDYQDADVHGTHVAGLIGAASATPVGLRGVAPGIEIGAYRVFGKNARGASNYAILKAMILAQTEGCDILNLSLGGGPSEPIVQEAILDARDHGMLVVVAAGNDGRRRVSNPAAYPGATAVSAMGHQGTFPAGSMPESDVLWPPTSSADPDEFIAGFSNIGPEIAVTGPGVGVLSTLPHNDFGPMSGTSMAAPVVAGAAASLLSQNLATVTMQRDRVRSDAIERLLQTNCMRRGFGMSFEGFGLPDPAAV